MKIIQGDQLANKILADIKNIIDNKKIKPSLAVILIGDNPSSHLYVDLKEATGKEIGVTVQKFLFQETISEKEILDLIEKLNADDKVGGIMIQLPLPVHLSTQKLIDTIDSRKDIEGFKSDSELTSPFIQAIWYALKSTEEDLTDKKAIVLAKSSVFCNNLSNFLEKQGIKTDFIIFNHQNKLDSLKKADIVITAIGLPNYIHGFMIKRGAIVIDGGIEKMNGKIVGDINLDSIQETASWLSPVPKGIGPLTIAFLFKNLVSKTYDL